MKKILIGYLTAISVLFANPPAWFLNISPAKHEIIGYGIGKSLPEAKMHAKEDIAKSIVSQIRSKTEIIQRVENTKVEKKAHVEIEESTDITLTELELIQSEKKDDTWYIALRYINLPTAKKIAQKIKLKQCPKINKNNYLVLTPLSQEIARETGCTLPFRIYRQDGFWYLTYQDINIPLKKNDFEKLFITKIDPSIKLHANKTNLYDGEILSFSIHPAKDGYVSFLTVYENGQVRNLIKNRRVSQGQILNFPPIESDMDLEVCITEEGKATYDLYIAIYTDTIIDLSRFDDMDETTGAEDKNYKFNELLEILNLNAYTSQLIRTKPKQ